MIKNTGIKKIFRSRGSISFPVTDSENLPICLVRIWQVILISSEK